MQTRYGVPKPSYRALQMLAHFPAAGGIPVDADAGGTPRRTGTGPAALCTATVGTVDVITAIDVGPGTTLALRALVANWNFNVADSANASTGLPIATAAGVVVTFAGLPAGAILPSVGTAHIVNSTHGWARPVWVAAGRPRYPSTAEIDDELAASFPVAVSVLVVAAPGGASLNVTLPDLEPYAFLSLSIEVALPPPRPTSY